MSDLPLSRHVVVRSANRDVVSGHLERDLPDHRLEFLTTDRRLNARLHAVRLPHMVAMYLAFGGEVRSSHDQPAASIWIHMPLSGSLGVQSGGAKFVSTSTRAAVASTPGRVAMTWTRDCATLVFRIERQALEGELAVLIDGSVRQPLHFDPVMDVSSDRVRSWFALASAIADELNRDAGLLDHPLLAAHTERVLLRGLLLCQPHSYSEFLHEDEAPARPRHIDDAVALLEARPERAYTVASLAGAVGVSARVLQDGFRLHLDASPMQYLRDVRLRQARAELLSADPGVATVADIAFRWGFTHLGRFAQYYRARYDEAPSDTLRARS